MAQAESSDTPSPERCHGLLFNHTPCLYMRLML
jgi:hypothetical protein